MDACYVTLCMIRYVRVVGYVCKYSCSACLYVCACVCKYRMLVCLY